MKRPSFFFDAYLRTGFDSPHSAGISGILHSSDHVTTVTDYRLDSPFNELLPSLRSGEAPFIIFADSAVKTSNLDMQTIEYFIASNVNTIGIALYSGALKTVYGFRNRKLSLNWLTRKPRSLQTLPSWFCIVNRAYLNQSGLLDREYRTLEFFLLDLAEWASGTPKKILLMESIELDLDARVWARDIILANSHGLASDVRLYKKTYPKNKVEIPCQFRVEVSGEYSSVPEDGQLVPGKTGSPKPAFSVICPVYKSRFFEETVKSVMAQTWEDWEFNVIIDGPPEEEKERLVSILEKYSDPRIRFVSQENMGTGPTRRRLAEMAKGDFVITIDDDDMFSPALLKTFALAIRDNPDVHLFRGGARLFGLVDLYLSPRQRSIVNGISSDLFEATQPFAIKRAILEELGGFVGDKSFGEAGEDSDLFLKIDRAGFKACLIDRPLYLRRISTLNQTLSFRPDECMDHIRSLISRHCPDQWEYLDIHFQKDVPFIKAAISYRQKGSGSEVTTATRFFDYQTLGESSDVLIDLEVTSLCNSVCIFCPRDALERKNKFIPMDLVDFLSEHLGNEKGKRQVILCGIGESTLHPELETIVKKLSAADAKVCMTTNGSRMNTDKFKALADAGIVEINFSINAATAETHEHVMKMKNFDTIKNSLRSILEVKGRRFPDIDINVSFVYCNDNKHELSDFVDEWRNQGVSTIWIHPVNGRGGLLNRDAIAADISEAAATYAGDDRVVVDVFGHIPAHGNTCKIVQTLDFISADGDMLLCALDYRASTSIGNLRDTTLKEMHLMKFLKYNRGEINDICHDCYFLPGRWLANNI